MTDCRRRCVSAMFGRLNAAAFFEIVMHAELGFMRGFGAVIKENDTWMIAHSVLSFSVPNKVINQTDILDLLAQI